jgi:hypothetical protein
LLQAFAVGVEPGLTHRKRCRLCYTTQFPGRISRRRGELVTIADPPTKSVRCEGFAGEITVFGGS